MESLQYSSELMLESSKPKAVANSAFVFIGAAAGVMLVGAIDRLTGPELALSILYLFPVGLATWMAGPRVGLAIVLLSAVVWTFWDIHAGRPYSSAWMPYFNGAVRLCIFATLATLLGTIRKLTNELQELVRQRTAALEAEIQSRKEVERVVTEISAREQQRLGADLHDQLAGHLTGLAFLAKAISESLTRRDQPEAADADKLVGYLNQALKQLRAFCRLLAPVDSGNLEPGLTRLGAQLETAFGVTCVVQASRDLPQLGLNRARLLYNIAQEAARSAVEKRMAKNVEISLAEDRNLLRLTVTDDGTPPADPATPEEQDLAVKVMRYRAETLGGTISVNRAASGGAAITCTVAVEPEAAPFPAMS